MCVRERVAIYREKEEEIVTERESVRLSTETRESHAAMHSVLMLHSSLSLSHSLSLSLSLSLSFSLYLSLSLSLSLFLSLSLYRDSKDAAMHSALHEAEAKIARLETKLARAFRCVGLKLPVYAPLSYQCIWP